MTLYDELVARVSTPEAAEPGECWEWQNATNGRYGNLWTPGPPKRLAYAHRVAYEVAVGPIPDGYDIDHLCRVHLCYRPSHLRAVTHRENVTAPGATSFAAVNARKTHCPAGHPLEGGNLVPSVLPGRKCLTCHRAHLAEWRRKRRGPHPPLD